MSGRDPIQRAAERDEERDLYGVVTWERRGALDRVAVALHWLLRAGGQALIVVLAALIVGAQFVLTALATLREPAIGVYILLSLVPAIGLATYVWRMDVTMREPLSLLVATVLLGFLFAGFAAVVNTLFRGVFGLIPVVGGVLFFYVVVGPVEETVKWLAVRLYAYRSTSFDAVIDGAVYGAVAGLGFVTIENSIYITDQFLTASAAGTAPVLAETFRTAAVRTLAGPGHVIYSAFAGYYLGLAKFNPERRGPIVVKGLLIAALIHATYNTLAGVVPTVVASMWGVSYGVGLLAYIVAYDGLFGYLLYRKLSDYRRAFVETGAEREYRGRSEAPVERDEFEWGRSPDAGAGSAPETGGSETGGGGESGDEGSDDEGSDDGASDGDVDEEGNGVGASDHDETDGAWTDGIRDEVEGKRGGEGERRGGGEGERGGGGEG